MCVASIGLVGYLIHAGHLFITASISGENREKPNPLILFNAGHMTCVGLQWLRTLNSSYFMLLPICLWPNDNQPEMYSTRWLSKDLGK